MLDKNSLELIVNIPERLKEELENQNIDSSDIEYILVFTDKDLKLYKEVISTISTELFLSSLCEIYNGILRLFYTPNADLELYIFVFNEKEYLIGIMYH